MINKSKKFGSFLITGAAATLPLLANNSLVEIPPEILYSEEPHLIQQSAQGINVLNMIDEVDVAAQMVYPGKKCYFPQPSNIMNLIVTGVRTGDYVYIASASDKNDPYHLSMDPNFKIGSTDFKILLQGFSVDNQTSSFISKSIDLNQIPNNTNGFYMQSAILREGEILFTELDRIQSITQNCNMYGGF